MEVGGVVPIQEPPEPSLLRHLSGNAKELRLAMVASLPVILDVFREVHLQAFFPDMLHLKGRGEGGGVLLVPGRGAGTGGGEGHHAATGLPSGFVGCPEEEGTVHSAREGHQHAIRDLLGQPRPEECHLFLRGGWIGLQ